MSPKCSCIMKNSWLLYHQLSVFIFVALNSNFNLCSKRNESKASTAKMQRFSTISYRRTIRRQNANRRGNDRSILINRMLRRNRVELFHLFDCQANKLFIWFSAGIQLFIISFLNVFEIDFILLAWLIFIVCINIVLFNLFFVFILVN